MPRAWRCLKRKVPAEAGHEHRRGDHADRRRDQATPGTSHSRHGVASGQRRWGSGSERVASPIGDGAQVHPTRPADSGVGGRYRWCRGPSSCQYPGPGAQQTWRWSAFHTERWVRAPCPLSTRHGNVTQPGGSGHRPRRLRAPSLILLPARSDIAVSKPWSGRRTVSGAANPRGELGHGISSRVAQHQPERGRWARLHRVGFGIRPAAGPPGERQPA